MANKGIIPPNAKEIEQAVLSAIIMDGRAIHEVIQLTTSADIFYDPKHHAIFSAILNLYEKNEPIDLLTVSNQLRVNNQLEAIGGELYLIELLQKAASAAHIQYHTFILLEKYIKRKSIHISTEIIEKAQSDDVDPLLLLDDIYSQFGQLDDFISNKSQKDFKTALKEYFQKKEATKHGVPSSIAKINQQTNGWQDTDLIILAARPGAGKTAFALNELLSAANNNFPVLMFSLEMGINQLISRMLSSLSTVDFSNIFHNNLTEYERDVVSQQAKKLEKLPIEIDDTPGLSPLEIKIKIARMIKEKNIKLVIIDYLQLIRLKGKKTFSKEQEVSEISASLKSMAKEFEIPIIALSQLSRAVETRGGSKRPLLSDLRDSGSIEQDADIVMFIYRPEYYKIDTWDDELASDTKNQADIEIAKHRNGSTCFVRVGCKLNYMQFMDLDILQAGQRPRHIQSERNPFEEIPLGDINSAFDEEPF